MQGFLVSTLLYQFTERGKAVIIDGLSWQFPSLLVLTMAHFVVWINKLWAINLIVTIHLSILTTYIYFIVKKQYPAKNIFEEGKSAHRHILSSIPKTLITPPSAVGVIHATFSMYHAWISYILLKAAFEAFDSHRPPMGNTHRVGLPLAMIALQALSAAYAFSAPTDVIGTVVISWILWGIRRQSTIAFVSMWISFVWVGKALWGLRDRKYSKAGGQDIAAEGEREPLLGSA